MSIETPRNHLTGTSVQAQCIERLIIDCNNADIRWRRDSPAKDEEPVEPAPFEALGSGQVDERYSQKSGKETDEESSPAPFQPAAWGPSFHLRRDSNGSRTGT